MVDRAAVGGAEVPRALGLDDDDLAVVGELDPAGLAEERGRVRGEKRLARRDPDDHRALEPRADEEAGMVAVDHDEGECPSRLAVGGRTASTRSPS